MAKHLQWLAPAYTLVIVLASLSTNVAPEVNLTHIDKGYHAAAYCLMTFFWYGFFYFRFLSKQSNLAINTRLIFTNFSKPIAIGAMVLCFLIGILIELGQGLLTSQRTMDIWDGLANTVGIIIAFIILISLDRIINTTKKG